MEKEGYKAHKAKKIAKIFPGITSDDADKLDDKIITKIEEMGIKERNSYIRIEDYIYNLLKKNGIGKGCDKNAMKSKCRMVTKMYVRNLDRLKQQDELMAFMQWIVAEIMKFVDAISLVIQKCDGVENYLGLIFCLFALIAWYIIDREKIKMTGFIKNFNNKSAVLGLLFTAFFYAIGLFNWPGWGEMITKMIIMVFEICAIYYLIKD